MSKIGDNISRGDLYWVNLDPTVGSESQKTRPAVVISNNIQNKASSRVVVIPITSNSEKIYPFESEIVVKDKKSKAMADQIRTIDKMRLSAYIGQCTKKEMNQLERAIKLVIAIG